MEKDPAYQRNQKAWQTDQLDEQIQEVLKRFDRNADGKLDREELTLLRAQVIAFSTAPPEMLAGRKVVVSPLLSKNFPPVAELLKRYDPKNTGGLDVSALTLLARQIQKQ